MDQTPGGPFGNLSLPATTRANGRRTAMSKKQPQKKSMLYYFTLSVVLSLLAAAALSQGQPVDRLSGADSQSVVSEAA